LKTGLNPNATILNIDTIDLDPSPSPSTKLAGLDTNSNFEIPSYTSLATSVQSHPQTETSSSGSSTQFEKGSQSPRIKADTPISNYQDSVSPISSQLSEVPNQIRLSPIIKTLCRQFQANSQKSPTRYAYLQLSRLCVANFKPTLRSPQPVSERGPASAIVRQQ
jgi:hypothetical protein